MAEPSREEKLKTVVSDIRRQFKDDSVIMSLGESAVQQVEGISTGALSLDIALGGYGLPRGRIIEIYGQEASGKTTVALHAVANAQKGGGVAAFIDAEHALDPGWAKRIGVDLESLLVSQPSCGEEALKIAEMLVRSNAVDIIVIDSVAALVPRAEVEGEIGDSHVGLQARLMSQALRILTPLIAKTRTCVVFINQIRQKIGVLYGNPETTSGGLALKFYSSVRLEIRRVTHIKEKDEVIGSQVRVKVVKNKVAPPFKQSEFNLMHDRGISRESDVFSAAKEHKVIKQAGSFFSYGDIRLGQGEDRVKEYFADNPTVMEEIARKVVEVCGLAPPAPTADANGKADEEPAKPEQPSGRGRRQTAPSAD